MVKLKRSISLVLSIATLSVMSIPCFAASNISNSEFFDCESIKQFENISFEEAKLIKIESDRLDTKSQKKVIDLVEKGTDIFIECERDSNTAKTFYNVPEEYSEEKADNFLGVYLRNDNGEVKASPLTFVCMYPENEEVSKEEKLADYKNIKENPDITADEIYNTVSLYLENEFGKNNIETMQVVTDSGILGNINKMFFHERAFMIAYYNSKEKEVWKEDSSSNYKKIGAAEIEVQLFEIGRALKRNYTDARIISRVYADGRYYVVDSTTKYGGESYITFSSDRPQNTTNTTITYSYSTNVQSNGTIERESKILEAYNPDGISFVGQRFYNSGAEGLAVTATPASVSRGNSWKYVSTATFSYAYNETTSFLAGITGLKIKNWKTYIWDDDIVNPPMVIALFENFRYLF